MTKHFFALWLLATALLAPLVLIQRGPVLQAAGMGLLAAAVGAAFLYADRQRPGPWRRAAIAVTVFCGLLWFGLTR